MPTKFGLIWIGLRGLKIPDKKGDIMSCHITLQLKLVPSQPSLAWFGLAWTEAELSHYTFPSSDGQYCNASPNDSPT